MHKIGIIITSFIIAMEIKMRHTKYLAYSQVHTKCPIHVSFLPAHKPSPYPLLNSINVGSIQVNKCFFVCKA